MVQELQVLKCFSCNTFQSQIAKKSNKWECKLCGTKQSIKKVYGQGSGKDCRIHTQKLNALRGQSQDSEDILERVVRLDRSINEQPKHSDNYKCTGVGVDPQKTSKWAEFIDQGKLDSSKESFSFQEIKNPTCGTPIKSTEVSRKKRKYELHSSKAVHDYPGELYDTFSSGYKTLDYSDTRYKKKRETSELSHTVNSTLKPSDQESSDDFQHQQIIKPSLLENKPNRKQKVETKISGKWDKYLEESTEDETTYLLSQNSFPETLINSNEDCIIKTISENIDECVQYSMLEKDNITGDKINFCKNVLRINNVDLPSKKVDIDVFPLRLDHATKNEKTSLKKATLSVFEQDCSLSDIDFELDF